MASQHDNVEAVRRAITLMRNAGGITDMEFARAMHYVASHAETVAGMVEDGDYDSVAVDVIAATVTCVGGNCE